MKRSLSIVAAALLVALPGQHFPAPAETPAAAPISRGTAIDGDTIRLANGRSVRLLGIDTAERGACGYRRATRATARFIRHGFTLVRVPGQNQDHYNRLLRYVRNRAGADLGAWLIRRGLAVARYDARDGYRRHPLQRTYRRLDRLQRNVCGFNPTKPPPDRGGRRCDPNYRGACVPDVDHDLDCVDIPGPVRVVGVDRHGRDRDGDGRAC